MAILIDPHGILRGKRVRRLGGLARLYYPYVLSLTNFYARLELDYEMLHHDLATIKHPLTEAQLEDMFAEYKEHGLCFVYSADGSNWCQFDTPLKLRMLKYAPSEADVIPAPPQDEYIEWLKSLHGDKWPEFNMSGHQKTLSEKRSEAGRAGGKASGEARRSKTNGAPASEPDNDNEDDDDDVVVDDVVRVEEDVIHSLDSHNAIIASSNDGSRMELSSPSEGLSSNGLSKTSNDKNPGVSSPMWYDQLTALEWAHTYRTILDDNPKFDPAAIGAKWESKWEEQFTAALTDYTPVELANLMAVSQTARCKDSCFTVDYLLRKVDKRTGQPTTLCEIVESLRKKNLLSATRADFKKKLDRLSQPQTPVDFIDIPDFEDPELD